MAAPPSSSPKKTPPNDSLSLRTKKRGSNCGVQGDLVPLAGPGAAPQKKVDVWGESWYNGGMWGFGLGRGIFVRIWKGICLGACMALCLSSCGLGEAGNNEEETSMMGLQQQVLTLTGVDAENFDFEKAAPSEKRLYEQAKRVEEYLAKKYPETIFQMLGCNPRGIMQAYDHFVFCVQDDENSQFDLFAADEGIADNYFGILRAADFEAYLKNVLKEAGVEANVYASIVEMLPEAFNAVIPIEEAAVKSEFFSYTWILLNPGEFETGSARIEEIINEKALGGKFSVYEMLQPLPEGITKAEVDALIPGHTAENPVYAQQKSFTVFCAE